MPRPALDTRRFVGALRSDPTLAVISRVLEDSTAWVVGGWIRDLALGRSPSDVDLVLAGNDAAAGTAASRLAGRFGGSPHRLGRPPRSIWAVAGSRFKIEIWPLGSLSLEEDAHRRDFSCNALLWRLPDGPLLDPTGGLEDLDCGLIRAVDRHNLEDDPVRLLRAPRLAATMEGHRLEPETRSWIADLAPLLGRSPRERIGREFLATVRTPRPDAAFDLMVELGLFPYSSPFTGSWPSSHQSLLPAVRRLTGALPHPVPAAARFARESSLLAWIAAGWETVEPTEAAAFAWPRERVRTLVSALAACHTVRHVMHGPAADRREAIWEHGKDFPTMLAFAAALTENDPSDILGWRRWWRQWRTSGARILADPSLLTAHEISDIAGLSPGPDLGTLVRDLRRLQVRRAVRTVSGARRWVRTHSVGSSTVPSSKSIVVPSSATSSDSDS